MGSTLYAIRDVLGKGRGLIAIENISEGTRILCEEPVITVPQDEPNLERLWRSVSQQVDALNESQRQTFLSLHNIHPYSNLAEQYLGIFRTNALPIEADGTGGGIFLQACRINHACDNNSQKSWNENIKRHTIHALRDINQGEEITIYYLGVNKSREARHEALQAKFGFTCSCRLCSLPPKESQESDERLEKIQHLDDLIGQRGLLGILSSPFRTFRYVDQQVQLYDSQGLGDSGLSRAFFDAAQIAIANGDLARGRIFAERAVSGWRTTGGSDCKEVLRHKSLLHDPSKLELYGMSMKWKTAVDEVPTNLETGDFEHWLWRRQKPQRPGEPIDLRNQAIFPEFTDLPAENVVDLDYYNSSLSTTQPRRHWCFLAEIVDFTMLVRLKMQLIDVHGREVPLVFYTSDQGSEIATAQLRKGYTVAILYAARRTFKFDKPGIRQEDPGLIKIFPMSLRDLLALSDLVQQFSTKFDGRRVCHGCGKKADSLNKCAKCLFFWYCNRTCQVVGWNEKSHKTDCKLLKDADLRGLLLLKWDEFDNHVRFPFHAAEKPKCGTITDEPGIPTSIAQSVAGTNPVSELGLPLFDIQEIPGKGKALKARVNIAQGTRILLERPLFTTPNLSPLAAMEKNLATKLKSISKAEQRQFHSLHNNFPGMYPFSGIVKTNALPCGPDSVIGGVYPTICFINHSCLPNAHNSWNSDARCETIHAIRHINAEEEITISYDKGEPSASRRAHLKDTFGFDCSCPLCSLPSSDLHTSDARRLQIKSLDDAIGDPKRVMNKPEDCLADCQLLLEILEAEFKGGAGSLIARLYYDVFQISITHGDQARASVFAERGYRSRIMCEGEDSPETKKIKALMEDPTRHRNFGASRRWQTGRRLVPKGLDTDGFEKWLWKRGGRQ